MPPHLRSSCLPLYQFEYICLLGMWLNPEWNTTSNYDTCTYNLQGFCEMFSLVRCVLFFCDRWDWNVRWCMKRKSKRRELTEVISEAAVCLRFTFTSSLGTHWTFEPSVRTSHHRRQVARNNTTTLQVDQLQPTNNQNTLENLSSRNDGCPETRSKVPNTDERIRWSRLLWNPVGTKTRVGNGTRMVCCIWSPS